LTITFGAEGTENAVEGGFGKAHASFFKPNGKMLVKFTAKKWTVQISIDYRTDSWELCQLKVLA